VYNYQPSLFVTLETHAAFARVEKFWASLGYFPTVIVESEGHTGGVWILSIKSFLLLISWMLLVNILLLKFLQEAIIGLSQRFMHH